MPETRFRIRWPDGHIEHCYSPSSVIADHLHIGGRYTVADFMARARRALTQASARVEQIYGRPCSLALAQAEAFEDRYATAGFADTAIVTCLDITPSSNTERTAQ
ncbi:MSMEG_0570 family nitrogen starvation response protein [Gymnodinialimonas sp. 2305UL16-5]|uniref:MSMEG_0570 family nitrogen starvation response protein n=1 Tax=Gymnodinialimonas mytili TaxID=3126503 RepID=UPI003098090C